MQGVCANEYVMLRGGNLFTVPDAMFMTSAHLDNVMAKSMKSDDQQLQIPGTVPGCCGTLSGLLDNINKSTEVTLEDMEGAVRVQ